MNPFLDERSARQQMDQQSNPRTMFSVKMNGDASELASMEPV